MSFPLPFYMQVAVEIPTFPLNTDGIDPRGTNVHIYNCSIENFDDAVAVKPMNGDGHYSQCSQNVLVEDLQVTWGVGMTIGSVPPDSKVCGWEGRPAANRVVPHWLMVALPLLLPLALASRISSFSSSSTA